MGQKDNQWSIKHYIETKIERHKTQTLLKIGGELRYSGRVGNLI